MISPSVGIASEIQFKQVSPDKILTNPEGNPRKNIKQRDIDKLCESIIACNGIIVPLVVFESPTKGVYYLLDGERRLIAAKKVGLKRVPVNIIPKTLASDVNLATMFTIHMARVPWNPMARAMALNHYLKLRPDMEKNKKELGRITGMSLTEIKNAIAIRIFPNEVQLRAVFPEKPGGMEPSYLIELAKLIIGAEKKGLSTEKERSHVIDSFLKKIGSIITDPYQLKDTQTLFNNIPLEEAKTIFNSLVNDPSYAIRPVLEAHSRVVGARFRSLHIRSVACSTEESVEIIITQLTSLISAIKSLNGTKLSPNQLDQLKDLSKQTMDSINSLS
jgi:ParB/RepB/Spo0J family partition protein